MEVAVRIPVPLTNRARTAPAGRGWAVNIVSMLRNHRANSPALVQRLLALVPIAGAKLVGLQGVENAQHLFDVASD